MHCTAATVPYSLRCIPRAEQQSQLQLRVVWCVALHGTPCPSRKSETPQNLNHTIVSYRIASTLPAHTPFPVCKLVSTLQFACLLACLPSLLPLLHCKRTSYSVPRTYRTGQPTSNFLFSPSRPVFFSVLNLARSRFLST